MEAVKRPDPDPRLPPAGRIRRRRLATGVALAVVGTIAAALGAEVGLRLAGYPMPVLVPISVRTTYRVAPNARFLYLGYLPGAVEDFANPVTLNGFGFHDRDYALERPSPSTYRILVLGDSYVAAWEVPLQDSFHKRLEARLEKEDPLGRGSYQVIAFGQGRSAQQSEIEWLRRYGALYRPDLVLLVFFCGNDFMENDPEIFAAASGFGIRYIQKVVSRKLALFRRLLVLPRSRLNGLVAVAASEYYAEHLGRFDREVSGDDLESPELGVYRSPLPPQWQAAFERTGQLLETARDEAARLHAEFALASLSGPQGLGELADRLLWSRSSDPGFDYGRPERWISDWARIHRVALIDLGGPLAKIGRRKTFWRHDQHLNSHGHAAIADLLYPFVIALASGR